MVWDRSCLNQRIDTNFKTAMDSMAVLHYGTL